MQRLEMRRENSDGSDTSEDWLDRELDEKDEKNRKVEDENVRVRGRLRCFKESYCVPGNGNDHFGRIYDKDKAKMAKTMKKMENKINELEDDLESEKKRR